MFFHFGFSSVSEVNTGVVSGVDQGL